MKLKDDQKIPADISIAFQKHERLLNVFQQMPPSCQKTYLHPVVYAKTIQTRKSRIMSMLNKILKYGQHHKLLATS
jgi:uncharacterized protein YdeI (YjbR/CyaY-like superfamily)